MPSQAAATPGFFAHVQPAREASEGHARDRLTERPAVLAHASEPEVPLALSEALADFSAELAGVRSRLGAPARRERGNVSAADHAARIREILRAYDRL